MRSSAALAALALLSTAVADVTLTVTVTGKQSCYEGRTIPKSLTPLPQQPSLLPSFCPLTLANP
jgi:hypothetical protein